MIGLVVSSIRLNIERAREILGILQKFFFFEKLQKISYSKINDAYLRQSIFFIQTCE